MVTSPSSLIAAGTSIAKGLDPTDPNHLNSLNYTLNNALFLTAIANLEWSRGYLWYVELDDVPFPFQRGGVIGLPVTSVQYSLIHTQQHTWGGFEEFSVPKNRAGINTITMEILDDEKGTIYTFLERWFNNVYNSYAGVLPVTEACKGISIYKLKSTRSRISRYTSQYDINEQKAQTRKTTTARDFLIYPIGDLQESNTYDSKVRSYNVNFHIVKQINPDYGNPAVHEGLLEQITGSDKLGPLGTFIKKASSYF